jgi:hypothetical protein
MDHSSDYRDNRPDLLTVGDVFEKEKISLEDIHERSEQSGSSYWENCYKFISDNWNTGTDFLSVKQSQWLERIWGDMVEWRIGK